jgi:hypothetical protein
VGSEMLARLLALGPGVAGEQFGMMKVFTV